MLAVPLFISGLGIAIVYRQFLMIPLTLGLAVPIVFRRAYPTAAFGTAVVAGGLQVAIGNRHVPADLAILVLLYTLAAYTDRRRSVTGLAICLLGSLIALIAWRSPIHPIGLTSLDMVLVGMIAPGGAALVAWVLGDSMRYRRAYYASLEERAAQLERDRDAQTQIAAAAERARIARELHDVIAHNVSVMVVQADGAAYALGHDPGRAREALAAISATGRQALTEMRVLLGVLRRADRADQAVLAPQPGIAQLDELLDQARAAGLPVSCAIEGEPRQLPTGTALAAYRIVQESLTNTRKHAGPRASASVVLRYTDDAVELVITDDGLGTMAPGDGAGIGLTGMHERAAMYGGSVLARPRHGGGFVVTARLPISGLDARAPAHSGVAPPTTDPAPTTAAPPGPATAAPPTPATASGAAAATATQASAA